MDPACGDSSDPSVYAVVSYIPAELGAFLNSLRSNLIPSCSLLSHVTLLPPRTLLAPVQELVDGVGKGLKNVPPFELGLGPVEKFPVTDVVYISIAKGRDNLESIHSQMNTGALSSAEPFPFHPHVTLAQEIGEGEVELTFAEAQRRWREWPGARSFPVDRATLVQNRNGSGWRTVAEFEL